MDQLSCLQPSKSSLCRNVVSKHFQIGKRNHTGDLKCCGGHAGNYIHQQHITLSCLFGFHLVVPHATFGVIEVKVVLHVDPLHLQACLKDPKAENLLVRLLFNNRKFFFSLTNKYDDGHNVRKQQRWNPWITKPEPCLAAPRNSIHINYEQNW